MSFNKLPLLGKSLAKILFGFKPKIGGRFPPQARQDVINTTLCRRDQMLSQPKPTHLALSSYIQFLKKIKQRVKLVLLTLIFLTPSPLRIDHKSHHVYGFSLGNAASRL